MQASDRQKIEQSIALLQSVVGGGSFTGSCAPGYLGITVPIFDDQVKQFVTTAEVLEPEIQELSSILVDEIKLMQSIMDHSSNCKKFSEPLIKALQQKYMGIGQRVNKIEQSQNFHHHGKAIKELIGATFWVFVDTPEFVFKGAIESADFNALKFQKLKNQDHNNWYKAVGNAFRTLEDFVKKNYSNGLKFNPSGSGKWEDLLNDQLPSAPSSAQPAQSHQSAKSSVPSSAAKKPKKQMQGINWLIANFQNQKLSLPASEVQMKNGIFIENCQNCVVEVEGKFKSLQMNKSNGMTLIVNSCVSGVEVINGQNLNIFIKGQSPSVSIDKCSKVRLVLNEAYMNVDIVTSKVSELQISYTKQNGQQAKDHPVSEQLITKWNATKKQFETNIYDKFL